MSKRSWLLAALAAGAIVGSSGAGFANAGPTRSSATKLQKVTLQLKWVAQAQFAGYFAAKAKGFYRQAGLDVKIKLGGPDISPEQVVLGGQAERSVGPQLSLDLDLYAGLSRLALICLDQGRAVAS